LGEAGMGSILVFGYMSLVLVLAVYFRSQFQFLQKLFLPGSIIAGIILLLLSPSVLNIVPLPVAQLADGFVYHLLAVLFIVLGLRGFGSESQPGSVGTGTVVIGKVLAVQAIVGSLIVLLVIFLVSPQLFSGLGSFLMLGFGLDAPLAQYFGGFWEEELAFEGGSGIAFSFVALGFLFAYILGLIMIVIARKGDRVQDPAQIADETTLTGVIPSRAPAEKQEEAGRLTTGTQSIDAFTFHLSLVGIILLITYSLLRFLAQWIVTEFDPGAVIVGEVLMHFQFFFAFVFALLARRIMKFFNVLHLLDRGVLNRTLGVAVDYMVVAAIVSIPLVVSSIHLWETLAIVIIGGLITLGAVIWLSRKLFGTRNLEREAALFGFVSGNISSSVALLRVVDPRLENPILRELTFAGVLSYLIAIPLIFVINLPLIGEGPLYLLYAVGLYLGYIAILFLVWHFFIRTRMPSPEEEPAEEDSALKRKRGVL